MVSFAHHQEERLGVQISMSAVLCRDHKLTERRADNETERFKNSCSENRRYLVKKIKRVC